MTPGQEPGCTNTAAVAGLAQEVQAMRRSVDSLGRLPARVDELARLIAVVADELAAHTAASAPTAVPSWLLAPTDVDTTRALLDELCGWLGQVYLRYTDAAAAFPDCWAWHPDLIEELLWLMHAWLAAYQGPTASVALVGDWHDRYRPGVVRRIKTVAGMCSLENHQPRHDGRPLPGAPLVPLADTTTGLIADWWADRRDQPAPQPTAQHLTTAEFRRRPPGGRR